MTIEIVGEVQIIKDVNGTAKNRAVEIIISSGAEAYLLGKGGLPLTGNLQTILDAQEAELFTIAQTVGKPVDLYEITTKRVLKAFALVVLDEINILRQAAGLQPRTGAMIEAGIKNKLKGL